MALLGPTTVEWDPSRRSNGRGWLAFRWRSRSRPSKSSSHDMGSRFGEAQRPERQRGELFLQAKPDFNQVNDETTEPRSEHHTCCRLFFRGLSKIPPIAPSFSVSTYYGLLQFIKVFFEPIFK